MTSTLPRRTAAVTALAVTAFSGVAFVGAAASSAATPKAHTSLSIRSARGAINPGGGDKISGDLRSPAGHTGGRKISLDEKVGGATTWTKDGTHRTDRHGVVAFQVSPTATTRYRLVFAGNKAQQGSVSGVVQVRVQTARTSLTIAEAAKSITAGQSDTISGVLSLAGTPLAGDTVNLLGKKAGQKNFSKVSSAVTAADGSVSYTVTPGATKRFVLVFNKTATDGAARSAVVTVHVLKSSSLGIRARSANHNEEVITGSLFGGGHALSHRKVTLQDQAFGSSTWTTVASKNTNHGGAVKFTEPAPTSTENYQLVFAGGPVFSGCQSGVVTVTVAV
jgi:hypothetical protein